MSKKLLSTLIASLFVTAPAFAQTADDPIRVQGTATVGGIYNNQNAADTAKLEEYQDLGNGALTNVGAWGRNSTTWFQGYGENFGRNDQYMFLRGGMYDVFKVGGYLNDMPHDFSSNAITPYNGVGGTTLTATFPARTRARGTRSTSGTSAGTRAATSNGRRTARGISASTATRSSSTAPRSARRPSAPARATATSRCRSRFRTARRTSASRAATRRPRPRCRCAGTTASSTIRTRR